MNRSGTVGLAAVVVAVGLQQSGSSAAAEVDGEAWQASGRIAYSTQERVIYTSAPDGTDTRLIVRGGSDPVWSPDGRWIAYLGPDRQSLWRVRADGTSDRRIPVGRDWTLSDPAWSPDGRRLAFTRQWAVRLPSGRFQLRHGVYTTGRDGNRTRRLHFGSMPTWSADGRLIAFRSNGRSFSSARRSGGRRAGRRWVSAVTRRCGSVVSRVCARPTVAGVRGLLPGVRGLLRGRPLDAESADRDATEHPRGAPWGQERDVDA